MLHYETIKIELKHFIKEIKLSFSKHIYYFDACVIYLSIPAPEITLFWIHCQLNWQILTLFSERVPTLTEQEGVIVYHDHCMKSGKGNIQLEGKKASCLMQLDQLK